MLSAKQEAMSPGRRGPKMYGIALPLATSIALTMLIMLSPQRPHAHLLDSGEWSMVNGQTGATPETCAGGWAFATVWRVALLGLRV